MISRHVIAIIFSLSALTGYADNSSWTAGNGKWETGSNWSLSVPPTDTQSILVTNGASKTVTVDATTSGSFPGTMTIRSLTLSAPVNSTNTLFLGNAGTNTPFHVLETVDLGIRGSLIITNSMIVADGLFAVQDGGTLTIAGGETFANSLFFNRGSVWVTGGQFIATNDIVKLGSYSDAGYITVSNGTVLARYMDVGNDYVVSDSALRVMGGTVVLSAGVSAGIGGSVWVSGGQLISTNDPISIGAAYSGSMTVSGGTVQAFSIAVGIGAGDAAGTLTMQGGAVNVYSNLTLGTSDCYRSGQLGMNGGNLFVTNAAHDSVLEVFTGTVVLNSGQLKVDRLVLTSPCSHFNHIGGTLVVGNLLLDPSLDTDGDGLPNEWEQAHGFDPLAAADGLSGSTNSWTIGNGKWETGGNWSLGVPPAITQSGVFITNANNKTVTIDASTSSNSPGSLVIRTLTLSAPTNFANSLLLGDTSTNAPLDAAAIFINDGGHLVVTNSSALRASQMYLGVTGGSQGGTFTVAGGITALSFDLSLGNRGTMWLTGGQLAVTNGTLFVKGDSQVAVSNGSLFAKNIAVGADEPGTLTIAGGTVTLSADLQIAVDSSGASMVWMTDGQLTATNGTIHIGGGTYFLTRQMVLSNGTVLAKDVVVDDSSSLLIRGGTMTLSSDFIAHEYGFVWVTGGQLTVTNGTMDLDGHGQLRVSNGIVLTRDISVGVGGGGDLIVEGGTATVLSNLTIVGCHEDGISVVVAGGSLFVTNAAHDAVLDVRGPFVLNSGLLRVDRLVMTDPCGEFHHNGGTLIVSNLVLDPNRDDDADGIPNGYEQSRGLDPLNAADANVDSDGDGQNNLAEFQAGTDATNSASAFRITAIARQDNTNILVTWMMGVGKTNALERTAGVSGSYNTNSFAAIFTVTNTAGTTTNYLDAGPATNFPSLYYRVRLVP